MATREELAREILPILVERVESQLSVSDLKITYKELSEEVAKRKNLKLLIRSGRILGIVNDLIQETGDALGEDIPPITMMVVNQNTGMPGAGANYVSRNYSEKNTREENLSILDEDLINVKRFSYWNEVLRELDITPLPPSKHQPSPSKELPIHSRYGRHHYGSEGSPAHRKLCKYVRKNPDSIKSDSWQVPKSTHPSPTEYPLYSGDSVDVVFENKRHIIGVEVKSYRSGETDIKRGIYQCVKYQAVLEAQERLQSTPKQVHTVLVIQNKMSKDNARIAKTLGVRHVVISQTQAGN